jgi:7-cyano-7-deazaguanine synthase in queuosine biosynthesis
MSYNKVVLFSGGLDSTYMSLKLFEESAPNSIILLHIILKNKWNRWEPELQASHKIRDKLKLKYKFKYIEIEINLGGLSPRDSLIWMQNATIISKVYPIDYIYVGYIKEDNLRSFNYQEIVSGAFNNSFGLDSPKVLMPIKNISKKEIINYLENNGYIDSCFWCRTPHNGLACGTCKTCKLYKKYAGLTKKYAGEVPDFPRLNTGIASK